MVERTLKFVSCQFPKLRSKGQGEKPESLRLSLNGSQNKKRKRISKLYKKYIIHKKIPWQENSRFRASIIFHPLGQDF